MYICIYIHKRQKQRIICIHAYIHSIIRFCRLCIYMHIYIVLFVSAVCVYIHSIIRCCCSCIYMHAYILCIYANIYTNGRSEEFASGRAWFYPDLPWGAPPSWSMGNRLSNIMIRTYMHVYTYILMYIHI